MNNPTGIKERSIPLAIVFYVLTFGIYGLYWVYHLHDDANALSGRRDELHPGLVVLLCIVTFGIYHIYWAYTQGEKFQDEARARGSREADDCPVLYLVLEIAKYFVGFAMSIANLALMQHRVNQILRRNGWSDRDFEDKRYYYASPEKDIAREYEKRAAEYEETHPRIDFEEAHPRSDNITATADDIGETHI